MLTVLIIILLVLLLTGGYGFSRRAGVAPSASFAAVRRASAHLNRRASDRREQQRSRAGNAQAGPADQEHLATTLRTHP
jgi:hypothetical protein